MSGDSGYGAIKAHSMTSRLAMSSALRTLSSASHGPILGVKHRLRSRPVRYFVQQFLREEDGQDVVEYGLLIATVSIVVLLSTQAFGNSIFTWFGGLAGRITTTAT
jgi:Flp pilus assembly pilin Flp